MVVPDEIKEQEEEEDVGVSLVRRKNITDAASQKSVGELVFRGAQLLPSALLVSYPKYLPSLFYFSSNI